MPGGTLQSNWRPRDAAGRPRRDARKRMPPTLNQFVRTLVASELMAETEVREFLEHKLPGELDRNDPEALARELVRQGRLTAFQATAIHQGKSRGLVFGEYVVLDKLGSGGMGRVFRAVHRRMHRVVALKVLPRTALGSPRAVERFEREVRAAARLTHPNIVAAYDAGVYQEIHYLVMEYVDGPDLGRLLRETGALPPMQAVEYILQAARGLGYAHGRGVVHRDVKPGNLLIGADGVVRVLDMGLARVLDRKPAGDTAGLGRGGSVVGTIDYMAPEQADDEEAADARSDVYSLGCTLHRLVTLRCLYDGETALDKLLAHREAAIPDLRGMCKVDDRLQAAFEKMVAKRPEDRFQSMAELVHSLEGARSGAALTGTIPEPVHDGNQAQAVREFLAGIEPKRSAQETSIANSTPRIRTNRSPSQPPSFLKVLLALAGFAATAVLGLILWVAYGSPDGRLVIDVPPGDRAATTFYINGRRHDLPLTGPIEYRLRSRKAYAVEFRRPGFVPLKYQPKIEPGQTRRLEPRMLPLRPPKPNRESAKE